MAVFGHAIARDNACGGACDPNKEHPTSVAMKLQVLVNSLVPVVASCGGEASLGVGRHGWCDDRQCSIDSAGRKSKLYML